MIDAVTKINHKSMLCTAFCALLLACGQGENDPIVAERELPQSDSAQNALAKPVDKKERADLRFGRLALDCVNKQFPNKISHVLNSADDVKSPQELYPAFYGCFDWHSAVHGHWMLVRLWGADVVPELDDEIEAVLTRSFTAENIEAERNYFMGADRGSFERPYGMVWFLQLNAELRAIATSGGDKGKKAEEIITIIAPLETVIVDELKDWILKLAYPIRSGTHSQTAFAFGLMMDWSNQGGDEGLGTLVRDKSAAFHMKDKNCPIGYEPSGEDFFSPCLMEADLMRRILPPDKFASWLDEFLPNIPRDGSSAWLDVAVVNDPSDGKLVHLDGLNLSRAWALEGIVSGLPAEDDRIASLLAAAKKHKRVGLQSVNSEFYAGSHWLASFATYLNSQRGLPAKNDVKISKIQ